MVSEIMAILWNHLREENHFHSTKKKIGDERIFCLANSSLSLHAVETGIGMKLASNRLISSTVWTHRKELMQKLVFQNEKERVDEGRGM